MKEQVYISIKGLHLSAQSEQNNETQEDEVEIINVGTYRVVAGKEYLKYDEVYEGESDKSTVIIKLTDNSMDITKKGFVTASLSFVKQEKTMTCYNTPFGNIYLGIFTRKLDIERSEEKIRIAADYSLELNYETVSDCTVEIEVTPQGEFDKI